MTKNLLQKINDVGPGIITAQPPQVIGFNPGANGLQPMKDFRCRHPIAVARQAIRQDRN